MDLITQRLPPGGSSVPREPTMFLKGNVIFYEGLEILPLLYHVVHCLLSVLEMVSRVSLQLITKGSEQAIAIKTKTLVKTFKKLT